MPSAWQGAWLGIWPGDWFGDEETGGGSVLNAALVAVGTGFAQFAPRTTLAAALVAGGAGSAQLGAVVEGGTVVPVAQSGGRLRKRGPRRRVVIALLSVVATSSAEFGAVVLPPSRGRTARRHRTERDLLLAA